MSEFFQGFLMALIFVSLYFGIGAWECGQDKKKLRNEIERLENQIKRINGEYAWEKARLWKKIREYENILQVKEPYSQ